MPLPKRQHSRQRGRKRRTHWKVTLSAFISCANCQKPVLAHRVCPFCGHYKGEQIVDVSAKQSKTSSEN